MESAHIAKGWWTGRLRGQAGARLAAPAPTFGCDAAVVMGAEAQTDRSEPRPSPCAAYGPATLLRSPDLDGTRWVQRNSNPAEFTLDRRQHRSFAMRRSGVRSPSAPLSAPNRSKGYSLGSSERAIVGTNPAATIDPNLVVVILRRKIVAEKPGLAAVARNDSHGRASRLDRSRERGRAQSIQENREPWARS